jgi:PPK2 family polyphosphate:nucleotide phosphotransferase
MDLDKHFMVKPGSKVRLKNYDPDDTLGKKRNDKALEKTLDKLRELQHLLYADRRYALLIVLQGLDASGKDGTIGHVMSGVNPQGCQVTSFKTPTEEELKHDFLWRVHKATPSLGNIGIFNRSHYEDVLVVRVHKLVPKDIWHKRYRDINDFEHMLTDNKVVILKFFLHISADEQKKRLEARVKDPTRNWKFSLSDIKERQHWDNYVKAYEEALERCSTDRAPWYVVPSNQKWFRNFVVAGVIVQALERMQLKYPPPTVDLSKVVID